MLLFLHFLHRFNCRFIKCLDGRFRNGFNDRFCRCLDCCLDFRLCFGFNYLFRDFDLFRFSGFNFRRSSRLLLRFSDCFRGSARARPRALDIKTAGVEEHHEHTDNDEE